MTNHQIQLIVGNIGFVINLKRFLGIRFKGLNKKRQNCSIGSLN